MLESVSFTSIWVGKISVGKIKVGGNKVKLSVYNRLPHVWQIFGFLPEAKQALREISDFLKN